MIKYFVNTAAHRLEVWDDGALVGAYGDTTGLPAGTAAFVPPAEWKPLLDAAFSGQATPDQITQLGTIVSQGNTASVVEATRQRLNGPIPTAQGTVPPADQGQGQVGVRESTDAAATANDLANAGVQSVISRDQLQRQEAALRQKWADAGLGAYPFPDINGWTPSGLAAAPDATAIPTTTTGPDGQPIRLPKQYVDEQIRRAQIAEAAVNEARAQELARREQQLGSSTTGLQGLKRFGEDRRALDQAQAEYDWQEKLAAANPANDKQLVPLASGQWTHNAGAANAIRDARTGLMSELATIAPEQAQMATRAAISPTSPDYVLQSWNLRRRPDGTLESTDAAQPFDPTFKPFAHGGVMPPNRAATSAIGGRTGRAEMLPPNLRRFAAGGYQQPYGGGGGYGGGYGQPGTNVRTGMPSAVGQSLDYPEGNNYTSPSIANLYQQHQKQMDVGFGMGLQDEAQQQTLQRLQQDTAYQTNLGNTTAEQQMARLEQDTQTSLQQMQAAHQQRMALLADQTNRQAATLQQQIAYARDQKYRGRFTPSGGATVAG